MRTGAWARRALLRSHGWWHPRADALVSPHPNPNPNPHPHPHPNPNPNPQALGEAQRQLLAAPKAPSFAVQNPTYEGVCQGNRKTCKCGQPFFS